MAKRTKLWRSADSASGGMDETMATEIRLFYIQDSRSYCGNSALWWRPNGNGYTTNLADAWRVDRQKAESICRDRDTDKMWPCDQIDAMAQLHFDSQNFTQLKLIPSFR